MTEMPGTQEDEETIEEVEDDIGVLQVDHIDDWAEQLAAAFRMGHRRVAPPVAQLTGQQLVEHVKEADATVITVMAANLGIHAGGTQGNVEDDRRSPSGAPRTPSRKKR